MDPGGWPSASSLTQVRVVARKQLPDQVDGLASLLAPSNLLDLELQQGFVVVERGPGAQEDLGDEG